MISRDFRKEMVKQMITLSTAGFGVVAALAWNDAIQSFVKEYIDKYFSAGSGIMSRFVYAVIITVIAVLVTYELTKMIKDKDEDAKKKE